MTDERRLKWTTVIVLSGIFLGYASYGTYKLGWGEIYPFASWRLYSAPVGINEPANTFRIYWLDAETATWQRQNFEPRAGFSRKEQGYILGTWSRRVLADSTDKEAEHRLRIITETLAPDAPSYRVVEESFYSLPLYADSTQYDTSTVVRFNR